MAVFVEIYLADLDDEPDGASLKITNDKDSTPQDVVDAFKTVYGGMMAAIDEFDAADAAKAAGTSAASSAAADTVPAAPSAPESAGAAPVGPGPVS